MYFLLYDFLWSDPDPENLTGSGSEKKDRIRPDRDPDPDLQHWSRNTKKMTVDVLNRMAEQERPFLGHSRLLEYDNLCTVVLKLFIMKNKIGVRKSVKKQLYGQISGIRPDIRYPARYLVSSQISGIWPDIRYPARYPVSGQISGIWPDIRYPARYPVSGL